ncbi:MAG: flagellin [Comamonadaceae bacterium]|nr:flagellin [Comamonadaceae bacterium]
MAAIINTNLQSLNAQRNLSNSQANLTTAMQRLSSGLRINSAKDDAAGLAISERMTTQTRGLTVAARNANDGISLAQTAEGALGSITSSLQRIRELAVQSRNATNNAEDRAALDEEVQQLKEEINRVARDTTFNGTNLLDGSFTNMAFQVGANQGQTIDIKNIINANAEALGDWKSLDVPATMKGDAVKAEVPVRAATVASGEFTAGTPSAGNHAQLTVGGVSIIDSETAVTAQDIDAALLSNKEALKAEGITFVGSVENEDLQFFRADGRNFEVEANAELGVFAGADFVGDTTGGRTAYPGVATSGVTIKIGGAGPVDLGEIAPATSAKEFQQNVLNAISTKFAAGSIQASFVDGALKLSSDMGDITIGGAAPAALGLKDGAVAAFSLGKSETGFKDLSVGTPEGSDNAILAMDAALAAVNSARAGLGAVQSRFETTVSNLNIANENLTASKSRILDADFAAETARLSAAQVLQQAGTAMVAQANQVPQGVLQLLQG